MFYVIPYISYDAFLLFIFFFNLSDVLTRWFPLFYLPDYLSIVLSYLVWYSVLLDWFLPQQLNCLILISSSLLFSTLLLLWSTFLLIIFLNFFSIALHLFGAMSLVDWCWEWLRVREVGDRGWDGWMASATQRTWVWVNSGSWWWTGRPGVLQSMRLQRVRHDWATEQNWTELSKGFQIRMTSVLGLIKVQWWETFTVPATAHRQDSPSLHAMCPQDGTWAIKWHILQRCLRLHKITLSC